MKLAVILPAYCAEAYLPECLDSVLNQTFRDFFVITINDASTDKTGEILEAYAAKDSRLQVFHLPENKGEPFACQFAMDMLKDVKVEYVARMDADDSGCFPFE
ncbi:glycosyltransferase family 2 protein [Neisseria subflava]|uniref:glycosyltransferase family 2 protein n=1 Tax=Neisseria subflava TaxID=28449 RepID=UPI00280BABCB|nr:glycosyltransferase [Neisseria subflava]